MQDLGHDDLWAYRAEPWEIRRPLYEAALTEVARMHTSATRRIEGAGIRLEREFSEQLYLWEQGYFFEHCLGAHFGLDAATVQRYATLPALTGIADHLAHLPRVLVHRDFQSQNILIHQGAAWLIDFQGMRPGLPQYDVASLLYDPYVTLSGSERDHLLAYYQQAPAARGWRSRPTSSRSTTSARSSGSCRRSEPTDSSASTRDAPISSPTSPPPADPFARWPPASTGSTLS